MLTNCFHINTKNFFVLRRLSSLMEVNFRSFCEFFKLKLMNFNVWKSLQKSGNLEFQKSSKPWLRKRWELLMFFREWNVNVRTKIISIVPYPSLLLKPIRTIRTLIKVYLVIKWNGFHHIVVQICQKWVILSKSLVSLK